ncbi:Aste57867_8471 [Aphanomyces stellatus]|uniref:Aste57867_8471 protein n=1 Tax=Aphanomyces stellatus TaxID=120398 RepID=A0A485KKI2_9STRA|nr:hypothetical protein As57867_008439 [Aphanomyces stellatus]VFT85357.1 Aste57867_8471 [Aphanomyces stellatus]
MPHRKLKAKLPLPPDFFTCPPLTQVQEAALIDAALGSLTSALRLSRLRGGPITWTQDSHTDGVALYVGASSHERTNLYLSVTSIHATLEEAASLMDVSTQAKYKQYGTTVKKDFLDCMSLYDLALPTPAHPHNYIGVKWCLYELPTSLVMCRDFCVLDCCDDFTLNGRRGWMRVHHSIQVPACPDLEACLGVIRGQLFMGGYIFLETDTPGVLSVTHVCHADARGNIPPWMFNTVPKNRVLEIAAIESHFRRKRQSRHQFLDPHELVPKAVRKKCAVCAHAFLPLVQAKLHCLKCGEVVCKKCSLCWTVPGHVDHGSRGGGNTPHVARICSLCTAAANTQQESADWTVLPQQTSWKEDSKGSNEFDDVQSVVSLGVIYIHSEDEEGDVKMSLECNVDLAYQLMTDSAWMDESTSEKARPLFAEPQDFHYDPRLNHRSANQSGHEQEDDGYPMMRPRASSSDQGSMNWTVKPPVNLQQLQELWTTSGQLLKLENAQGDGVGERDQI